MKQFYKSLLAEFNTEYYLLYNDKKPESTEQVERFDKLAHNPLFRVLVQDFAEYRKDIITSDRESNAFMNAIDNLTVTY